MTTSRAHPRTPRSSSQSSRKIIDKGVTPEELERTKTRLIADAVYAQDNQTTMARWYGAALTTGATVNDVRSWTNRIPPCDRRDRCKPRQSNGSKSRGWSPAI